jgi:hypothetical protein
LAAPLESGEVRRIGSGVTRKVDARLIQRIGGEGHTLLRFTEPDYLRDDAILVIETRDRGTLTWLYRSEDQRMRRLGVDQKADSFYGSDLTFEDLEHHDWDGLRALPNRSVSARDCFVVEAVHLPPEARALLSSRSWPGNVRELEAVLVRTVAFTRGRSIRVEVLEDVLGELEGSVAAIRERRLRSERAEILAALRESGGNVTRVAERFGKSRPAIYRLMQRHRIPLGERSGVR